MIDFLTSDLGATIIAGALALAGYLGRRFVLGLIRWKRGREALERLGQHASRAVLATHQELVEAVKAAKAYAPEEPRIAGLRTEHEAPADENREHPSQTRRACA